MERIFRIRASAASKILGRIGLTKEQFDKMELLKKRDADSKLDKPTQKPLTEIMQDELKGLIAKHTNQNFHSLPQTAKSYLHEWYANDFDDSHSKYTQKGEWVEDELIDFAASKLGLGVQEKNRVRISDEYFDGECDVDAVDLILDVKAPWDKKSLHEQALKPLDFDYKIQLIVYCHLYKKPKGCVFYGLMDTPGEVNYSTDVYYSGLPDNERWFAHYVNADPELIEHLKSRVLMCREYLNWYDVQVKSKLGKAI